MTEQLTSDSYHLLIPYEISRDLSVGSTCGPFDNVFTLPLHTRLPYLLIIGETIPFIQTMVQTPSLTVTTMPSSKLEVVWYPHFDDSICCNDGNQASYMQTDSGYLFTSAEACFREYFNWSIQDCRKKVSVMNGSGLILLLAS